ncbi:MAG: hypothetical protein P8R48_03315 [Planctomycetota bacterium]|nr:hypothetical protein [Planctomycetota bacterium]
MKEQVQKNRFLGLDQAYFLPAWAALVAFGSCGSTPDTAPESAPEFQLAAPVVAPVQGDAKAGTAYDTTMGKPAAVANVAPGDAPVVREPQVNEPQVNEPEVVIAAEVPAPAQPEVELTPEQQVAAVTLSAPPAYRPDPNSVVEVDEPKSNVQRDLQSLLLSPAWQERAGGSAAEVAEEQRVLSELEAAVARLAAAELAAAKLAAAKLAAAKLAAAKLAAAELAAAKLAAAELAAAELAAAELAAAELAAAELAAAELAAAELAATKLAVAALAAEAELAAVLDVETPIETAQDGAVALALDGEAAPVEIERDLEKSTGIIAQVSGETFGSDITPVVAVEEQLEEDGPMTKFDVTWPESIKTEEPTETAVDKVLAGQPKSYSDFEAVFDPNMDHTKVVEDTQLAVAPDLEPPSSEALASSNPKRLDGVERDAETSKAEPSMVAEGEELDSEFQELEQVPVGLSDVVATMMQPSFEPVIEPTLAPIARSMAFLEEVPIASRAMAGPLFALDPSGFLGNLALGASMVEKTANQAMAYLPPAAKDLDLPDGERLAAAGPVLSDEETKKLAEEPSLGWLWWDEEVPSHHVGSKVDIQTPSVGRVRIVLASGDYVEGILYAVGKGLYWIDGDLGRFSVKHTLVSHVERLLKPGLGAEVEGLQAGHFVRVKLASGFVEGRLVSTKGDSLLIETNDGIRMTLESTDVERLGDSKTRVIVP